MNTYTVAGFLASHTDLPYPDETLSIDGTISGVAFDPPAIVVGDPPQNGFQGEILTIAAPRKTVMNVALEFGNGAGLPPARFVCKIVDGIVKLAD